LNTGAIRVPYRFADLLRERCLSAMPWTSKTGAFEAPVLLLIDPPSD